MKKLLKVLQIFLIVFMFIIVSFTIITLNFNKEKDIFGYKIYTVLSDSMKPKFQAGDIIITKKIEPSQLQVGDIITYYSNDPTQTVVTHEIIRFEERDEKSYIVTKGINVDQEDSYLVNPANVLGRFSFSIPKAGYVAKFIKSPLGFGLTIALPLVILLTLTGIRIVKLTKAYRLEAKRVLLEKDELLEAERKRNLEILEEMKTLKEQLQNGNNG